MAARYEYAGGTRPKRHPLRNTIIVLVIIGVLGTSGYLVADSLARTYATQFVQAGVAQELDASYDKVHVDLGRGSILPQLIAHKVTTMRVRIDSFQSGTLAGSAVFDAQGVPLNTTDPVTHVAITVSMSAANMLGLVEAAAGQPQATVSYVGGDIQIASSETLLGKTSPVTIAFVPKADGTQLLLTPQTISIAGKSYTPTQLRQSPIGRLVAGLLATRSECIAGGLPASLKLTDVAVVGQRFIVSASGSDVSLGSLSTKGSCPTG